MALEIKDQTFGSALEYLQMGTRVAREGWNGKGMWLVLVRPEDVVIRTQAYGAVDDKGESLSYALVPWIGLKTAQDQFVPWVPSQADILAEDWQVV